MVTTFKAFLNERRRKSDGTYPLIIRITADRKQKELPLNIFLCEADWDKKYNRVKPNQWHSYSPRRGRIVTDSQPVGINKHACAICEVKINSYVRIHTKTAIWKSTK